MRWSYDNEKLNTTCTLLDANPFNNAKALNHKRSQGGRMLNVDNINLLKDLEEEIKCVICMNYLNNPCVCSECEVSFCQDCISTWMKKNKTCPQRCNGAQFTPKRSLILRKILDKIIVSCSCGEKTSLLNLSSHKCITIAKEINNNQWDEINENIRMSIERHEKRDRSEINALNDIKAPILCKQKEKINEEELKEQLLDMKIRKEFAEWRISMMKSKSIAKEKEEEKEVLKVLPENKQRSTKKSLTLSGSHNTNLKLNSLQVKKIDKVNNIDNIEIDLNLEQSRGEIEEENMQERNQINDSKIRKDIMNKILNSEIRLSKEIKRYPSFK